MAGTTPARLTPNEIMARVEEIMAQVRRIGGARITQDSVEVRLWVAAGLISALDSQLATADPLRLVTERVAKLRAGRQNAYHNKH